MKEEKKNSGDNELDAKDTRFPVEKEKKEKKDFQVEFSSMSFEYPSKNITDLLNPEESCCRRSHELPGQIPST